ncbi:hypothetical protein [Mycolicibacterium rhodesiae]|uniref:hypothetical protein n=1 Tax=Mycolicibacterium rhodesiae TaxID=36814 RepID=UPI0010544C57|nr:hypothetical protein [Mycolicibacterium rhodesiae]MCV7343797.1 hypothetical protein [Mycolicibacterium rhodesiae]
MPDEDNVIDVEAVEITEGDNLPAVVEASTTSSMNNDATAVPRWSEEFWHRASPNVQARRCVGHKRNGDRCLKAALKGATVCRTHGGATRRVQRAARIRLENAQDLMAQQLLGVALTAESESVKLAAIKDVLDRGGLRAPTEVVLSQSEPKPYEQIFEGITTMSREESRRARGVSDASDDIAGLDGAHLHASSQEGATHHSSHPPDQSDSPHTDVPGDSSARRESLDPTAYPRDHDTPASGQHEASSAPDSPMHRDGPRRFARERDAGPPARHITGDEAIRQANAANRQIGALPPPRELESPHKRYPRP